MVEIGGRFVCHALIGVQFAFARGENFLHFAGADHCVDFGNLLSDFVAVALDHAAGNDQLPRPAEFLVLGHFQNGIH